MQDSKLLGWHKEELEKDLDILVKHNISEEDSEDRLTDYERDELLVRLRNDNTVIGAQFIDPGTRPVWPNNDTTLGLRIGNWAGDNPRTAFFFLVILLCLVGVPYLFDVLF